MCVVVWVPITDTLLVTLCFVIDLIIILKQTAARVADPGRKTDNYRSQDSILHCERVKKVNIANLSINWFSFYEQYVPSQKISILPP